jgi:hypothetical protein
MDVSLGDEEHPLTFRVAPLAGVLAAVGVRCGHDRVGGAAELLGVGLVAADEDDQGWGSVVLGVAVLERAPAADQWS